MDDVFPILEICGSFLRGLILALMKSCCFVPFSLRFFHREVWPSRLFHPSMDLSIHFFLCFKAISFKSFSLAPYSRSYIYSPFFRLQFPAVVPVRSFMGLLLTHGSTTLTLGPCLLGLGQLCFQIFGVDGVYKRIIQAQDLFDNVILLMLFILFENMCG